MSLGKSEEKRDIQIGRFSRYSEKVLKVKSEMRKQNGSEYSKKNLTALCWNIYIYIYI